MRNILVFMLTGLFVLVSLTGCATTAPAKTQLQIREFQTRNFETTDDKAVLKALVNVLQDDGYIIKEANTELGLLSATKEVDLETAAQAVLSSFLSLVYDKNSIIEATANVTGHSEKCRVRATFQVKKFNNKGEVTDVKQIDDEQHYTEFFAKVHKGIFLDVDQGL